jgi:hypothetical protein
MNFLLFYMMLPIGHCWCICVEVVLRMASLRKNVTNLAQKKKVLIVVILLAIEDFLT